jgi:hypothetical protein
VQEKAYAAARKAAKEAGVEYVSNRVVAAAAKVAEQEQRLESVLIHRAPTKAQMIANTLTHVWNSDAYASDEHRAARIAALAAQYGMSVEVAMSRIGQGTVPAVRPVPVAA